VRHRTGERACCVRSSREKPCLVSLRNGTSSAAVSSDSD